MKTAVGDGRLGLSIQVIRVFQILRGETESYFDRVLLRQTAEKFQYISILFQISIRENQDIGVSLHYNTVHRPLANGLNKKIQVILLLNLIAMRCVSIARVAKDTAGMVIAAGIGALIGIQGFMNIAVATMMMPNTGLPLPFVSYGLSSLVSMYIGIGFVLNVGLQRKNLYNF